MIKKTKITVRFFSTKKKKKKKKEFYVPSVICVGQSESPSSA